MARYSLGMRTGNHCSSLANVHKDDSSLPIAAVHIDIVRVAGQDLDLPALEARSTGKGGASK